MWRFSAREGRTPVNRRLRLFFLRARKNGGGYDNDRSSCAEILTFPAPGNPSVTFFSTMRFVLIACESSEVVLYSCDSTLTSLIVSCPRSSSAVRSCRSCVSADTPCGHHTVFPSSSQTSICSPSQREVGVVPDRTSVTRGTEVASLSWGRKILFK